MLNGNKFEQKERQENFLSFIRLLTSNRWINLNFLFLSYQTNNSSSSNHRIYQQRHDEFTIFFMFETTQNLTSFSILREKKRRIKTYNYSGTEKSHSIYLARLSKWVAFLLISINVKTESEIENFFAWYCIKIYL